MGNKKKHDSFTYDLRELQMYYQPQISLVDGRIIGAEALLRIHTENGIITPETFLKEIELCGDANRLDKKVYSEVCRNVHQMLEMGIKLPVSVNFSRNTVKLSNFTEMLIAEANNHKIPHELLEIEVTEGVLAENTAKFKRVLHEVMDEGFTVAIDDFGKGYSSLGFIKDVDFNTLKIDMEFLQDFEKSETKVVIECVITLAKRLNKRIIAEGVEKREQAEYLKTKGCDAVQGFYFAKPMELEQFVKFVREYEYGIY